MTFQYVWLRMLEILVRARRPIGRDELAAELAKRGFRLSREQMSDALEKLRQQGLVQGLVLAEGGSSLESVAATASGERKVRGIIRL